MVNLCPRSLCLSPSAHDGRVIDDEIALIRHICAIRHKTFKINHFAPLTTTVDNRYDGKVVIASLLGQK